MKFMKKLIEKYTKYNQLFPEQFSLKKIILKKFDLFQILIL